MRMAGALSMVALAPALLMADALAGSHCLSFGNAGDDERVLKAILACDPRIHPLGRVTPTQTESQKIASPPRITDGQPGCWSLGKWYPEGAKTYPDPRSRMVVSGYFICKNGAWVFVRQ
jgi:hypothetical protein